MARITKKASVECWNCKATIEYTHKDVKSKCEQRVYCIDDYSGEPHYSAYDFDYIKCPDCKETINLSLPFQGRSYD